MTAVVARAWKSRAMRVTGIVVVYVALLIWVTWPLAGRATSAFPAGTWRIETVPLFNAWTIWWNSDRALHGFQHYWNAPIFHPTEHALAFSEPQPMTLVAAPVIWLTGSRVLAYNFYLAASLLLNGIFAYRLLRTVAVGRLVAMGGGAAMIVLPIVHAQLDVLQLIPIWGVLWTWTACWKLSRRPTLGRGLEAGVALAAVFLTCGHQGLFLAVLLAGSVWILPQRWLCAKTWVAASAAVVVAALLVAPIAIPLQGALKRQEFIRPPELVTQLSALPGDYAAVTGKSWIDWGQAETRPWKLSPGWIKVLLASFAVVCGLSRPKWRRWTAFLLITILFAFLLSLGPNLRLFGWRPWWTLVEFCPGFAHVRNVFRFAFFVQIAVVLCAAQGLHFLRVLNRRFRLGQLWRTLWNAAILTVGTLAIFETRPAALRFVNAPDASAHAGWIEFVRDTTPQGRALACFPFPNGDSVGDYELTARWMYYGTFHAVPLVNGYSGFFPQEYLAIQDAVNAGLPSPASLRKLSAAQVEYLVVNRNLISREQLARLRRNTVALQSVFSDAVGIEVFRLR